MVQENFDILVDGEHKRMSLHEAAMTGNLDKIDRKFLTTENLMTRNGIGATVFHYAAGSGHMDQIPKYLLNANILFLEDYAGSTPLSNAIEFKFYDSIPKEFCTPEILLNRYRIS